MRKTFRFLTFALLAMLVVMSLVPAVAQDEPTKFTGGWPYQVLPNGHFNMYTSGRIDMGIYIDLMQPPLSVYIWSEGTYDPIAAASFGFDEDNNYLVTLKEGLTWSDGTPMTSADLVATFNTGYLIGWNVWTFMDSVEVVDDLTAKFVLSDPSFSVERQIMVENLRPASVYGDFGDRAAALIADGKVAGDADFDALLTELTEFRPEEFVSGGPYILLAENISDASVTLVRNAGGVNSDVAAFDEVVLWNGETEAVTPLVQNGELAYGTYGFPPASEADFITRGIDIIRGPSYTGPGLYFNYDIYPLNVPEVRQAIAYAIDRDANGFVSLGESGVAVEYMMGFSDNIAEVWLSDETLDSLNTYDFDPEGATAILEGIGFTKGDDGVWIDDQGNRMSYELTFPAEFSDWAAAAENATQALNDFGIEISARGIQFQQQEQDVYDSNFQIAVRNWGIGSPFPGFSYLQPYNRYNGQGELAGQQALGMKFEPNVTYSGGELNVFDASNESLAGLDVDAQKVIVEQLALSFNELLPVVPLWERYGNNPLNREFLNAPEGDDPIYINAGADHFMPYLIMTGGITPADM